MATRIGDSIGSEPRIIVDCTLTFQTGAGTGIQRVVRHIADSLIEIARDSPLKVVPARVAYGQLIPIPLEDGRIAFPLSDSAREVTPDPDGPLWRRKRALRGWGRRLNRLLHSRRFEDWLEAGPNANGLARLVDRTATKPPQPDALRILPTDILLSCESSWVYDIRTVLEKAGQAGATRVVLLHDVLPLSNPQWFTDGTLRYFRGWLRSLLPELEGLITTTATTRDELRGLVKGNGSRSLPEIAVVRLGAEIVDSPGEGIRPELRLSLAPGRPPTFLTVGTLEPRKNVDYALDIFDELLERDLDLQWHIVGAPGWLAEHTAQRIQGHAEFGRRLRWWTTLSDNELAWAYRHAAALVAVSKAEGFGLPLVEARFHGLPVFASDIPVFHEVLGSEGRFLPLSSPRLAAAILEDFLVGSAPGQGEATASQLSRPWRESARELLDAALRMQQARSGRSVVVG